MAPIKENFGLNLAVANLKRRLQSGTVVFSNEPTPGEELIRSTSTLESLEELLREAPSNAIVFHNKLGYHKDTILASIQRSGTTRVCRVLVKKSKKKTVF